MAGAPDEVLSERDRLAIIWFEEARLELVESFCEMLCALRCDDVHLALARAKRVSVACRAIDRQLAVREHEVRVLRRSLTNAYAKVQEYEQALQHYDAVLELLEAQEDMEPETQQATPERPQATPEAPPPWRAPETPQATPETPPPWREDQAPARQQRRRRR